MSSSNVAGGLDPASEGEMEEGEVRIYDRDSYIDSNGQVFAFKRDKNSHVDWNKIRLFGSEYEDLLNLYQSYEEFEFGVPQPSLQDRLGAAQTLRNSADFTHHIRQNMDSIAFADIEQEPQSRQATPDARKTIKIMQFGMQYYMFAQEHLTSKCLILNDYLNKQNAELEKLEQIHTRLKHKVRKQRHIGEQLNEQAIHYEVLMRRLRPDILEKRMKTLEAMQNQRKDIQAIDENDERSVVPGILKEQGMMQEGQSTIVYDRVAHLGLGDSAAKKRAIENEELREQLKKMDTVLTELQSLKDQVQRTAQLNTQNIQQLVTAESAKMANQQRQQSTQKYQSPVRDLTQEHQSQFSRTSAGQQFGLVPTSNFLASNPPLQDSVEESIRSQTSSQVLRPKDDSSSAPVVASYPDQIHVDHASTSWKAGGGADKVPDKLEDSSHSHHKQAQGPSMRRVLNPYGSSDQSGSFKSAGSSSSQLHASHSRQSRSKVKRPIEIEKVSELEVNEEIAASHGSAQNNGWAHQGRLGNGGSHATDDSYQDDDFESQSLSRSKDQQKLQDQIDQEREKQNLQKQVQLNRQVAKQIRQAAPSKKDAATPIKEEAVEEESDLESDPRKKKPVNNGVGLPLDHVGLQNWASKGSLEKGGSGRQGQYTKGSSDRVSQRTFERDSRQDDLQDELRMVEEQSKQSQSNSIPIENESASGNYGPSLVEKARNMTGDKVGMSGTQRTSGIGESSSLANDELRNAGSTQFGAGSSEFPGSANRSNSGKKSAKKEVVDDDDDEYIDDEFDVEEEESGSGQQASSLKPFTNLPKYDSHSSHRDFRDIARSGGPPSQTEIDFNISASASMLPPLAGGGKKGDAEALMSAYNVNLAESASFDYQISSSMGGPGEGSGAARRMTHQSKVKRERDHSLGDGTESMNSSDFAVSQSKISSSAFGSFDQKATSGQRSSKQKQRSYTQHQPQGRSNSGNSFYQANFAKFSNFHTADSQQPAVEEDIQQR